MYRKLSKRIAPSRLVLRGWTVAVVLLATSCPQGTWGKEPIVFNRDVRPILSENCFLCHGPDAKTREADLRLDTLEGSRADLGGYFAIKPGDLKASTVWARITTNDPDEKMPPPDSRKELTAADIEVLRRWIEEGAEYQEHWSFMPLTTPTPPTPEDLQWASNVIDLFIRDTQEQAQEKAQAKNEDLTITPATQADRVTLIRRVSFDLTGTPPTPTEVEKFVNDRRPGAYERLVDRLLASPRFGERLAIYWLDLVRYADTVGYHGDQDHNAAMYREYVIRSFNAGMPFDQFTIEQLAGDLLPSPTDAQLAASGYNRLLQTTHEGGAQDKEYLAKYASDRVRNVSTVWMGATLGCAECHDHKYDPYTQKDFYSMAAFFADLVEQGAYNAPNSLPTTRAPEKELLSEPDRLAIAAIDDELQKLAKLDDVSSERRARREELEAARKNIAARGIKQMISQTREPRTMRILNRGDWMDNSGEVVQPQTPDFLPSLSLSNEESQRATRLDLANWLVSREQPQTSRVLVNRLWAIFMGAGLSRGMEDTGSQGQWPTHPALLDYLASDLIDNGWQLKPFIRQLVTSSVYRQSSIPTLAMETHDPQNLLWTHQNRFRLSAEMIRDQALLVSGLLVEQIGGRSARPYQPEGYYSHLNFPVRRYRSDRGAGQYRRGVYIHWQRQFLHPMLLAFDAPTREECTAMRPRSNTPQAALVLLNDPSFVEAARRLAARVLGKDEASDKSRLNAMWQLVVSRTPTAAEADYCQRLLKSQRTTYDNDAEAAEKLLSVGLSERGCDAEPAELAAWTVVARALLGLSETTTRN